MPQVSPRSDRDSKIMFDTVRDNATDLIKGMKEKTGLEEKQMKEAFCSWDGSICERAEMSTGSYFVLRFGGSGIHSVQQGLFPLGEALVVVDIARSSEQTCKTRIFSTFSKGVLAD